MGTRPSRVHGATGALSRRDLLKALGIGVPGAVIVGCTPQVPSTFPTPNHNDPDPAPFTDGVICGDPLSDGAVIWTRLSGVGSGPVGVLWSVALDAEFTAIVAGGIVTVDESSGHSVHVRVDGLDPDAWYFYRFEALGAASRTGRLRTAPAPGARIDHLRFAFASCQQLNDSWFVAHRAAAAEPDLDFFVHLGDYVYASDGGTQSLADYRDVYRRWRAEPMLREFHAAVPMIAMWDDGEFYNDVDRHGPPQRLSNARQAWFENMPVINPGDDRVHRSVGWGDLADVAMIDVRTHRDRYISDVDLTGGDGAQAYDPGRTQLGAAQYEWLLDTLASSQARWKIVGNGVPISPWRLVNLEFLRPFRNAMPPNAGMYIPSDGWDAYAAERRSLLGALAQRGVDNTVFVTGQTHISIASELSSDPDSGVRASAAEFVSQSMTADPDVKSSYLGGLTHELAEAALRVAEQWLISQNPGMAHLNLQHQGYVVVDVTPEELVVRYRNIDSFDPDAHAWTGATFRVRSGSSRIELVQHRQGAGSVR